MSEANQTQNDKLSQVTEEQLDKEIYELGQKLNQLYAQKWESEMKKYKEWQQKQKQKSQDKSDDNDHKDENKDDQQNNPYFQWFQWFEKHMNSHGPSEFGKGGPHQHPPNHPHFHHGGHKKFNKPPHFNPFFMWMQWQQHSHDKKDWCPYDGRRGNHHEPGQKKSNQ